MNQITKLPSPVVKGYRDLQKGDVIDCPQNGEIMFEEWSRGMKSFKFVMLSNGKRYKRMIRTDIFSMKFTVIGTVEIETVADKFGDDAKNLVDGDLFVIDRDKGAPELFRFKGYGRNGNIKACSPIDESKGWNIASSFTCVKVENLF